MIIRSQLYGKFEIENPVIIDLIRSDELQRLKGISQMGVPDKYYHLKGYSRFEHSLGVMLLLRRLGASKESQIAGLTHDISHTAFSHVIDWLKGNSVEEDFQDRKHEEYLMNSGVSKILEEHGYDPKAIAELENYPLLEREIPDLCADRVDYALREVELPKARGFVEKLNVKNNQVVFEDRETSLEFAREYLNRQVEHWGEYEAVSRYSFFAEALDEALESNVIEFEDFWGDDNYVLPKLKNSGSKKISGILNILKEDSLRCLSEGEEVKNKKFRYVDPMFISNGGMKRLSQVDEDYKLELKRAREKNEEGTKLPRLPYK